MATVIFNCLYTHYIHMTCIHECVQSTLHPAHISLSEGFLKGISFKLLSKSIYPVVTQQTCLLVLVLPS